MEDDDSLKLAEQSMEQSDIDQMDEYQSDATISISQYKQEIIEQFGKLMTQHPVEGRKVSNPWLAGDRKVPLIRIMKKVPKGEDKSGLTIC